MHTIFQTTLPFFGLVLAGYLAARMRWLPIEAVPGLNAFVLFFALPALLFRLGLQLPLAELLHPSLIGVYTLSAWVLIAFTLALSLGPGQRLKQASFSAFAAAYPNNGFMGLPLIVALLGPGAAGPVMSTLMVDVFITSALCIALASADSERDTLPSVDSLGLPHTEPEPRRAPPLADHLGARLGRALRSALSNPLPWAIAAGALAGLLGLVLPLPLARFVGMLADAASPVALFTLGAVLRRAQWALQADPDHDALSRTGSTAKRLHEALDIGRLALFKLLLHPLLMLLLGVAAIQLGAQLSKFQLTALVLVAALPTASSVALLAERYKADTARVVHVIMVSTSLAFVSFTLIAQLLT
jgi:malonate transporter